MTSLKSKILSLSLVRGVLMVVSIVVVMVFSQKIKWVDFGKYVQVLSFV